MKPKKFKYKQISKSIFKKNLMHQNKDLKIQQQIKNKRFRLRHKKKELS